MNCREVEEKAPLYLSGELDASDRASFEGHLAGCQSCAAEVAAAFAMDTRVREASSELPDASRVQSAVRRRIVERRRRSWWQAAAVAAALVAAFLLYKPSPAARVLTDAAKDHAAEVTQHQPRRWRTSAQDIAALAARYQLTDLNALAPEGYRLEHAKMCGLDHQPALHLVYTNGSQEYSVYVRSRLWSDNGVHASGSTVSYQNDRVAIIATGNSSAECLKFAEAAARVL